MPSPRIRSGLIFLILFYALLLPGQVTLAQDVFQILPSSPGRPESQQMLRVYLRRLVEGKMDQRLQRLELLRTPEQIFDYQQQLRSKFIDHLGGFFLRTPLDPRIVGRRDYPEYSIEKIIYQSQPHFYVPGLLYLPKGQPPYPGVLFLCGHAAQGKAHGLYQRACILMARNGLAVFCIDPLGQGERVQLPDSAGHPRYAPTTEHMLAGIAPILLGRNLAGYMIWDAMRAIDYMQTRDEIEGDKIGCAGNSGGGNRTAYLMALDDRVAAASSGCFITTTVRKNETPGPGDAEQNIYAQIDFGMDHADYIIMRAPKPTLICSATHDYVPIEGAWESYRQAKRIYSALGYPERIDLAETGGRHGFDRLLRTATARWMCRWLLGQDGALVEHGLAIEKAEVLRCTPEGQVRLMEDALSVYDLYSLESERLAKKRAAEWPQRSAGEKRAIIRELIGCRSLEQLPRAGPLFMGCEKYPDFELKKVIFEPEAGILLPALLFEPERKSGGLVLYLHGEGKHLPAREEGAIRGLVRGGVVVLSFDLRGCGETATTPWRYLNALPWLGANAPEFFIAYMLGKSFLGMRTEDVLTASRWLVEEYGASDGSRLDLIAVAEAGPPALHAAALESDLYRSLTLERALVSWNDVVRCTKSVNALVHCAHGVLQHYDLPDLVDLFGADAVRIINPGEAAQGM